jgi:hypothetical protein
MNSFGGHAYPVLILQAAVTVNALLVVRAKFTLDKAPPVPPQLTVVKPVRAVLKVTGPETVRGAAQDRLGVQTGVPPPPPRVSVAPLLKAPVLTAADPDGAMTTLATLVLPSTGPVDTEPVLVVRLREPLALKKVLPSEIEPPLHDGDTVSRCLTRTANNSDACYPVAIVLVPVMRAAPVAVIPKPELTTAVEDNVRAVTVAAASSVTPTEFETRSGTPSAAVGVQLIVAEPPRDSCTLPEPAPVLRLMAVLGVSATVPAALPLREPRDTEPPFVTRLRVETEFVTTPASEIPAVLRSRHVGCDEMTGVRKDSRRSARRTPSSKRMARSR